MWGGWRMNKRHSGDPPSPAGPPSSPGSLFSWWTRAAQMGASLYLSCPADTFFWSTSGGAPAPCSWWPSGGPAAWAPGPSHRASPLHLDEPPAAAKKKREDKWDESLSIMLKLVNNNHHAHCNHLFEFSHSQPVHPPQLLLWEFRCIWSDFLREKKISNILRVNKILFFFCSFFADRRKDSNLIAVVAVFLLVLKSLFPEHGCLLLLCLLGLLLLLFLHIIGQLEQRRKWRRYSKTIIINNKQIIIKRICTSGTVSSVLLSPWTPQRSSWRRCSWGRRSPAPLWCTRSPPLTPSLSLCRCPPSSASALAPAPAPSSPGLASACSSSCGFCACGFSETKVHEFKTFSWHYNLSLGSVFTSTTHVPSFRNDSNIQDDAVLNFVRKDVHLS